MEDFWILYLDWVHVEYVDGYKDIKEFLMNPPKIVF